MIISSLAVARAQTVPELLVWRFVQALGASPGYPIGAGVIGDIYRLEERGTALGIYFGVSWHLAFCPFIIHLNFTSPHFSVLPSRLPLEVRLVVHSFLYNSLTLKRIGVVAQYWSWRAIHYLLAAFTCSALFGIFFFFPETSHPNTRGIDDYRKTGKIHPRWRPVLLNPLSQMLLLRSPNVFTVVRCVVGFWLLLSSDNVTLTLLGYGWFLHSIDRPW